MNSEEIVRLAAETGAKAAMEKLKQEREQEMVNRRSLRLHNTKLLLRNYRSFKAHAEHAVYEAECSDNPMDILEDFMAGRDSNVTVESIKRSSARTAVIVEHIEAMMRLYQAYCTLSDNEEDRRRWRVVDALFISEDKRTILQIADQEKVVKRTVYNDIDAACERISALMFGIDGLQGGRK